jgi:hypothetical protein
MTDGSNQNPGGENGSGGAANENQNGDNKNGGSGVSYETYTKAIDEIKKTKAKLKELEDNQSKIIQEKMKTDGDWKGLLDSRESKIKELESQIGDIKSRYDGLNEQVIESKKLGKVLSKLGGSLDSKYFGLIDLDEVKINPETNDIDELSVIKVVDGYKSKYPETLKKTGNTKMMGESGGDNQNGDKSLTYDAWLKLPYAEKNRRMKDVKLK